MTIKQLTKYRDLTLKQSKKARELSKISKYSTEMRYLCEVTANQGAVIVAFCNQFINLSKQQSVNTTDTNTDINDIFSKFGDIFNLDFLNTKDK